MIVVNQTTRDTAAKAAAKAAPSHAAAATTLLRRPPRWTPTLPSRTKLRQHTYNLLHQTSRLHRGVHWGCPNTESAHGRTLNLAAAYVGEKFLALFSVPFEPHRVETVDGLREQLLVFADGAEGPQRERFEVGARLQ